MKSKSPVPMRNFLSIIEPKMRFTLAAFFVLAAVPAVFAATDTWNGASLTSSFWSDGANWVATTPPNTNDSLIFDGTSGLNNTNNLTVNAPLGGLTFAATAGAFILNGNAIAPSNAVAVTITNAASVPEVINFNIAPVTNIIFGVAAGGSLTNNGVLSGSGNVSQTGSGALTFTATNTFTGPIGGIAGTLAIGGAGLLNNGFYTNNSASITNNGTFSYNSSANQTIGKTNSGTISGTGQLIVNGPGTLTLSASNTYTGGTIVNGGILALNYNGPTANDNGLPTIVGTLTINPGARVNATIVDAIGYLATPSISAININGGTFNNSVSGNQGYTTTFNLTGGTISSTGGGALNLNTGFGINTFATNIVSTISAPVVLRGVNLTYTVAAGTVPGGIDLVASGVHSINGGNGVLVKAGAGTLALTAVNTFNGGLIVSNGTFDVNVGGRLNSGNFSGSITNFATINFNGTNSQTLSGTITNVGTIAFNSTGGGIVSGSISGTGSLIENGSGSLTLSGVSTYSGATTVSAGELIGVTGNSISNSAVTIAAGATNGVQLAVAGGQFTSGSVTFNPGTTYLDLNFANNALSSSSAPLNINGNLVFGGTLNIVLRNTFGIPTGDFPLIKYSGTLSGTPPTTAFVLPSGVTATIFNNVANQSIDLNVTVGNQITWATGTGAWDFSTYNWLSGVTPAQYSDGQYAIFEDTKSGASPISVTLNTTVSPANVTFNNSSKSYTISGSGSIAGAASVIKNGTNTLTLANNNTYTNSTTLNAGTTILDYSGSATSVISTNSSLVLGGGTLQVNGNNSSVSTQAFVGTTFASGGGGAINAASATPGATIPVVALSNLTYNAGATVVFNGPPTTTGLSSSGGQQGAAGNGDQTGAVTATASILTTTGGNNATLPTGSTVYGAYATVGLYDFAATVNASAPYNIVGASQASGGSAGDGLYTIVASGVPANANEYVDVVGGISGNNSSEGLAGLRFNTPGGSFTEGANNTQGNAPFTFDGVLITPNVGATNVPFSGTTGVGAGERNGTYPGAMVIWQNNTLGFLTWTIVNGIIDGKVAGVSLVKAGAGTLAFLSGNSYYTGQTYLNGGTTEIVGDSNLGAVGTGAQVNLNGGTVLAGASFTLDNAGANKRPISIGFNGGGFGAISNANLIVDGTISGAAGTGPLWIGIPASSANGNTLGLLPGSGPNTANLTPVNAIGTVSLTGANTYTGGTILYSGILNFIPGSLGVGGVTLAGGTLQWASGNTADISANNLNIVSPGGALDANGNTVTLANPIGAGGNGALTLVSATPNSVVNLNGANTYTGGTTISNNTLVNLNNSTGSATGSGTVTVQGSSAASGASLTGGGTIGGNLTVNSGGIVLPGNGVGTLTVGSLTIDSGSTFNYEFNSTPTNDLIIAGGLTINDASHNAAFNLYQAGTTIPLTVGGTYNLVKFSGSIGGSGLDSTWTTPSGVNPHIGNPQVGSIYSFGTSGGYLTLTVAIDPTVTIGVWNVDANGNWSDATKWSSNPSVPGTPGPGDSATFGAGSVFRTVTLDAPQAVGGIRFTNNNSFLIANAGQTLTLNNKGGTAPIYVTAGKSNTIQTAVSLSDNALFNVGSGDSLALSGTVGNSSVAKTLTINGAGTVALSGNNSYGPAGGSFGTTLANGTLQVGNNNALGAGDVAVTGISTIGAIAPVNVANNIDVGSGVVATITNTAANGLTLGGIISDSGALVKTGNGTVTLANNNTYTGGLKVNGGTISISQDANLGSVTTVVLNGGGLLANATTSLDPNRNIGIGLPLGTATSTGFLDAASGQILTVAGTIGSLGNIGTNNLTVNSLSGSTGTVLLSSSNTFNGTTIIGAGTLQLANPLALQNSTLNYSGGGSLAFDPSITAATLGALSGSNNISLLNLSSSIVALTVGGNNASTVYYGNLTDGGAGASLVKNGNGTFTLKGTNNFTGTTTVNSGTLEITNSAILNVGKIAGNGFYLVDGGSLTTPTGVINTFNTTANLFLESSGTVNMDTYTMGNSDGMLITITGGSFSANILSLQRSSSPGNNVSPTATAPLVAPTTSGFYVNGTNASVNLGSLTIGAAGANSSGAARLDSGVLTVTNQTTIGNWGNGNGRYNILQVNGGLFNDLDTVNGIVISAATGGVYGYGELYLAGGTTLSGVINFGSAADTAGGGYGFLIVTNASLYVGSGGITHPNSLSFNSTISLISGVLGALSDWSCTLPMQMNSTNFTFRAADTNGVAHAISLSGAISGASALTKIGNGTLTLSATNTYTGNTVISNGTLVASVANSIATTPNLFLGSGATLDVSAFPFVLGASQTLQGSGTNNGSVNTTSGSKIYAGTDGTYGTNTFNNNLTLAVGATAYFDVSSNYNGSNDLINVGGNLTLNGNSLNLKAQSTSANLDTNSDYVLFKVAGTISGSFASAPVWGVQPANASRFTIVTDPVNKQVRLHAYPAGVNPPTAIGSASPSNVYGLQSTLITVTVTPGSTSTINSVVLDTSSYGGTSPVTLVQVGSTSVYTNTITLPSNPTIGNLALAATVTDANGATAVASIALTVNPGLYWVGGAGDNNWGSGGNWLGGTAPTTTGSILTFAGAIRPTPNMEQSYSIAGLTFDTTASSFILGSAGSSILTLTGSVVNNSPNVQTLNLPVAINGAQTINTASTNITMNGIISDGTPVGAIIKTGANTLTLTNANTFSGGMTLNASSGTLALLNDYSGGYGGQISVASGSTVLLGSANAAVYNTLNMRGGSTLQLRANSSTTFQVATPITAPSSSGALNFDVNDLTSGFTGNTLTLSSGPTFSSSADQTINVTGNSTYALALGAVTLTSSSHNPFFNLFVNTLPTGPNVTISSVTFGNWGNDLDLNGGGNVTITGNLVATSNGEIDLFVNNGTTATLQGASVGNSATPDGNRYIVVNGTLVLDNSGALYNDTYGAGLNQSLFILGAVTNVISGSGYSHSAATLTVTNNSFNAAVYLGDSNNLSGGLYVNSNITNNVADGDVGFTNSGTFTIGGQNTSGVNYYYNPIILGWTPNRGKSVTMVAATGGEVDFVGSILQNGTNTTAGVTIGNGTSFAGLVSFQAANTYAGPTIINNGRLALSGSGLLTNSTPISVGAGATFDVTAVGGFTLGAVKPQTLNGNGSVNGSLTTLAGSTVAPGFTNTIGTLAVNGNVTLAGTLALKLNRTNAPSNSDHLTATGTLTLGGALTVTNIGPALQANDTFQLFSSAVSGFTTVNIATNDANKVVYTWENDLATLGSIKVLTVTQLVNTNPATANFKAVAVGGSLQFTWAPDHLGWQLYTNSVGVTASSSWFPVAGSAAVTNETITIIPAKPNVFFQLRYP